jgi:FkbM family methyltransferase
VLTEFFGTTGIQPVISFAALQNAKLLGKVSRYPLRILPKALVVPILQGPARGKKWIVGSQRHAFWLGSYEPKMQKVIAREVRAGGVFYDVGANVGFYSLLASLLVGPGKVFAFEPLPGNVTYLRRHLMLNAINNVEVFELAICDQVGTSFFEAEETGAMGHLQANGKFQVATSTLDSLLQEEKVAPPNYVKMDIEGTELNALQGGKNCFQRYKPVLFLATHGMEVSRECCELLRSWDYELRSIGQMSEGRAEILARPHLR